MEIGESGLAIPFHPQSDPAAARVAAKQQAATPRRAARHIVQARPTLFSGGSLADLSDDPDLCATIETMPPDERKVLREQANPRIRRVEA